MPQCNGLLHFAACVDRERSQDRPLTARVIARAASGWFCTSPEPHGLNVGSILPLEALSLQENTAEFQASAGNFSEEVLQLHAVLRLLRRALQCPHCYAGGRIPLGELWHEHSMHLLRLWFQ